MGDVEVCESCHSNARPVRSWRGCSIFQAHGAVLHTRNNIRTVSTPIYKAIVEALVCGEVEAAMLGTCLYITIRLNDGNSLSILGGDLYLLHERSVRTLTTRFSCILRVQWRVS